MRDADWPAGWRMISGTTGAGKTLTVLDEQLGDDGDSSGGGVPPACAVLRPALGN